VWGRRPGRRADHPPRLAIDTQSALLVPVPEAEALVSEWRQRYDSTAAKGIPAHITVLAPFVPPDVLDQAIEDRLRTLFSAVEPVVFRLARPERFPGVLYLAPEPAAPFAAITRAVHTEWPEHPPYGGAFEDVIPHLTVVDCGESGACEDPGAVMDAVERAIVGRVPIHARADEVWLMVGNGTWSLRTRYRLGG
jgi:2'-5' RNA ligase